MVEKIDVLICGSGSAGLCAGVWLARYGVRCKILEKMDGPLQVGQADGVQCRTVEIFSTLGKAEQMVKEAYHVSEIAFWNSNTDGGITRTGQAPDTPLSVSHLPHVILNQARVNEFMLDLMREHNDQHVDYGYEVTDVSVDSSKAKDPEAYPVTVKAVKNGQEETFLAKYLFGSDGAHSQVRRSLGYKMVGDSTNKVWGVMDTWPRTDFPDIRKKCAIRSKEGNILIIPREGDSLCRFYIELSEDTVAKDVTRENLFNAAKKIFSPYEIDFPDTFWWSAYSIGQRRADFFHKDYRAFLAGDACHTHSPKAGQGMNVSLQDGYNFGWKVASVLKGVTSPELLETYVLEREKTATDLIEFDRYWTKLWSEREGSDDNGETNDFSKAFKKAGDFMAGIMVHYAPSTITLDGQSSSDIAKNLTVGMRFPSAKLCRMSDAKPMQLMQALSSDTRWRIVIFGGDMSDSVSKRKVNKIGEYLVSPKGPVRRHTPHQADVDSFIETLLVLSGKRTATEYQDLNPYFWPATGKWKLRDLHKIFFDDEAYEGYSITKPEAYNFYQIDPTQGAIVIVRPDGYISGIFGLDDYEKLGSFFDGFALPRGLTSNGGLSNGNLANGSTGINGHLTNGFH